MIDDILGGIFGEALFGRLNKSRRAQLIARLFFGLLAAILGVIGAVHFLFKAERSANTALHSAIIVLFVSLACFALFNVALARPWRWPGRLFVASIVSLFLARILFGA